MKDSLHLFIAYFLSESAKQKEKFIMHRFSWKVLAKALGVAICVLSLMKVTSGGPAHASACGSPCYYIGYEATASNTSGYITYLVTSNPNDLIANINASPGALLQVMQAYDGTYDPHPVGVWYNSFVHEWTIFNEDLSPMPSGTLFDITVEGGSPHWDGSTWDYTQVTATASNSAGDFMRIDDPVTNNNPSALVFITQKWTGTYDMSEVGAYYDTSSSKWAVFNEDQTPIPSGATFNLALENAPANYTQTVTATYGNTHLQGYITSMGSVNFPPLMITQVYNPNGICGCYVNNHPIGNWYDSARRVQTVFNVDKGPIPYGAAFFVMGE